MASQPIKFDPEVQRTSSMMVSTASQDTITFQPKNLQSKSDPTNTHPQPFQQTAPGTTSANSLSNNASFRSGEKSTIEIIRPALEQIEPASGEVAAKRVAVQSTKQYTLPDGTVSTTGKGLGKGRPGVKRGPRPSKSSYSPSVESTPTSLNRPSPIAPSTPTTTKRKRTESNASNSHAFSAASSHSRDSTPEYNPSLSQTRSGRQTQRPISIITTSAATESPPTKKTNSSSATSTPNLKTHPKIKRRVYKGKEQFALCEHCLRSFGPPNNVIVFCDACNKCWHQRCHNPNISKELVADTKAEWFCSACDKILHGNKKTKKTPTNVKSEVTSTLPPPAPPPVQKYGMPIVGAVALTPDQQRAYLNTLSKDKLINIILKAGSLAPQLPMFETPLPVPIPPTHKPMPQFASNYVTPVDPLMSDASKTGITEVQDEVYDDRLDEHAALYPKPGEGVQLPPDRADLHILLEGPDSRTFSHWVKGMNMKNYLDNVTLVQG